MRNAIFLILFPLLLCGCGSTIVETVHESQEVVESIQEEKNVNEPEFSLFEYQSDAMQLHNVIFNDATILTNMANYEVNVLKNLKKLGAFKIRVSEDAIAKGFEKCETSQEQIAVHNENIQNDYKKFILIEYGDNKEAQEINTYVRELYENYNSLYDLVLNPPNDEDTLRNNAVEYAKNIVSASDNIKLFCKDR